MSSLECILRIDITCSLQEKVLGFLLSSFDGFNGFSKHDRRNLGRSYDPVILSDLTQNERQRTASNGAYIVSRCHIHWPKTVNRLFIARAIMTFSLHRQAVSADEHTS